MATDWRWCWTPKRLKVRLPTFTTGFVLPSIKIVYYQHLLVSFEGLLSLRLSDHFALVVGCINNNWLNLWKKDAFKVFTGISPPLWKGKEANPSTSISACSGCRPWVAHCIVCMWIVVRVENQARSVPLNRLFPICDGDKCLSKPLDFKLL